MRPRRVGRSGAGIGLHIAPMIDVVFLLLVYFMVATDFSSAEEVFRMDLPEHQAGVDDPLAMPEEPLVVHLHAAGAQRRQVRLTVDGPWTVVGSPAGLRAFLTRSIVPSGTLFLPDHPVLIRPSDDVRWDHVVETFNAAVSAGCTHVAIEASG